MAETVELTIATVVYRGAGLSRDGGIVTFVPGALAGERVRAEVTALRRNYREARLLEVLDPSPDRIAPCCRLPDGTRVPGCDYDHVAYGAEVAIKDGQLRDFLRRLASDAEFLPPFPSPRPLGYRNKVVFHVQRPRGEEARIGYLGDDNRTVVDIPACPLAAPAINYAWERMRPDALRTLAHGETITFRHTRADGVVSWAGRAPADAPNLTEDSPAGPLAVPPDGFYQVNPPVAAALVGQVREWIAGLFAAGGVDTLLDLYCGVGVFGLAAAQDGVPRLVGVESGRASVEAAAANAAARGAAADFHRDTVAAASAKGFYGLDLSRAVAIADPPRQGMERAAATALADSPCRGLVYVSCDPATFARDLALLVAGGFAVRKARLFDMVPRTCHFESAALLTR